MKINRILPLFLLSSYMTVMAGPTTLTARLDSATMLMGNVNTLRLEVVQDKGVKGRFPIFEKIGSDGFTTLLNDTIEISEPTKIDTLEIGSGRIQINYEVPVQVFDSGFYKLPQFVYVTGRDSVESQSLPLTVKPVKVTADDPISPMTDVAEPENPSIFDKLPDAIYYWWWAYLLAVLIVIAGIYLYKRYKKEGTILPRRPQISPYDRAMNALRALKARKLWQSGREKEYYTDLTDILRVYLDQRFGIKAMEMTSSDIMSHLADLGDSSVPRDKIRDILDMADFVKFAMVRPLPDDNEALYRNALDFVESTKPAENTEKSNDGSGSDVAKEGPIAKESAVSQGAPRKEKETDESGNVRGGRRGRSARLDDSASRISGQRMKVGGRRKEVRK